MRHLNALRMALLLSLCAMLFCACNGAPAGEAALGDENTGQSPASVSPVPGYEDGSVPWEAGEGVVPVSVEPQGNVDSAGKGVRALRPIALTLPSPSSAAALPGPEALAEQAYSVDNALPSEVQGLVLDASSATAYACYELALADNAALSVGLAWYALPRQLGECYVGLADRGRGVWVWYSAPDDGILSFADESERSRFAPSGTLLVCVALDGGQSADLWKLRAGVEEMRGTGLVQEDLRGLSSAPDADAKTVSALPASVDLNDWYPAVRNQGSMGSCTAFAVTDCSFNIQLAQLYSDEGWNSGDTSNAASPMWAYIKSAQDPIGNWFPICGASSGRYMSQAYNVLKLVGSATEETAPYYSSNSCSTTFPSEASSQAALLRITDWGSIGGTGQTYVDNIRTQLATHNRPVAIALYGLEDAFLSYQSGVYQYQGTAGYNAGHAICITGYDDAKQAFQVRNSWGSNWGDDGYVWIGYTAAHTLHGLGRFQAYYMIVQENPDIPAYFLGSEPVADETEPNNNLAGADALPVFPIESWSGSLGGADSADYYSFAAHSGKSSDFSLSFAGSPSVTLELVTSGGSVLATDSDGSGLRQVSYTWPSSTTGYLRVSSAATMDYTITAVETSPPATPANFAASKGSSATGVELSWTFVNGAQTYNIERASSAGGSFTQIGSTFATSYSDQTAQPWTHYWYRVSAVSAGQAGPSCAAQEGYRQYPRPASMSASNGSYSDRVVLSWSAVSGATGYLISRSVSAQGPFSNIGESAASPFSDYSAQAGVTYYYRVAAVKGEQFGPPSDSDTGSVDGNFPQYEVVPQQEEADESAQHEEEAVEPDESEDVSPRPRQHISH